MEFLIKEKTLKIYTYEEFLEYNGDDKFDDFKYLCCSKSPLEYCATEKNNHDFEE